MGCNDENVEEFDKVSTLLTLETCVHPPPFVVISAYIWNGVPPLILSFLIQYNPSCDDG